MAQDRVGSAVVQTEVDGVPTLWLPGEGTLHAGLVFRVGRSDESLARGGITHLVEHLVLHDAGQSDYHVNGCTGPITTTFYTHGPATELVRFFAAVCATLADLPAHRLDAEKDILRTEAGHRGDSVVGALRRWRYGPVGPGLSGYDEFGLTDLTMDDLRAWVAKWFTRGNAALWIAGGPPPDGLRLDLPDGPRQDLPAAKTVLPRTPAYFTNDINGVGFDAVLPRGAAASAFSGVLERRLAAVLRRELGLSYTTSACYEPRDSAHAMLTAYADALPDRRHEVAGPFVDILIDLARGVSGADELRALRVSAEERLADRDSSLSFLQSSAQNILTGYPLLTAAELRAELEALTVKDISAVGREVIETGLIMVPPGQAVGQAGFTQAPPHSATRVTGQRFSLAGRPTDRRQLVIGTSGVSLIDGPNVATVHFADCAGMLSYPDGGRVLFAPDAVAVQIEPTLWTLPPDVLTKIDQNVPAERIAHLPARKPEEIPTPEVLTSGHSSGESTAAAKERKERWNKRLGWTAVVTLSISAVVAAVMLVSTGHSVRSVIGVGVLLVIAVRGILAKLGLRE